MAGPFVKLFGSMLSSSVWCESASTKLVWITMLLLADGEGIVWAAVPGIARQAGVSVEDAREAIARLTAPDPESRTKAEEGRRLVVVDGGWRVVNARKYRELQTDGQRKASERARKYRAQKRHVTERDGRDASRASRTEEEEEEEPESYSTETDLPPSAVTILPPESKGRPRNDHGALKGTTHETWLTPYVDVFGEIYPKGKPPIGAMVKNLRPLDQEHGPFAVVQEFRAYLRATPVTYLSIPKFCAGFGSWQSTGGGRRKDDVFERSVAAIRAFSGGKP